jgi:putative redox protein
MAATNSVTCRRAGLIASVVDNRRWFHDTDIIEQSLERRTEKVNTDNSQVIVCTADGICSEVTVNGHALVADEPPDLGGTGAGPTPYDYLLAALGSCTAITVRMYADRKGWPLESVRVRLGHGRIHAKDCEECETKSGRLDHIELELDLEGPLDDEQRQRLREMADRCPVHRTLESEVLIQTRTAP